MLTETEARDLLARAAATIDVPPGEPLPVGTPPRRRWLAAAVAAAVADLLIAGGALLLVDLPSPDLEYLDLEDLLGLVRVLDAGPVRDVGLLDSAAARPRSSAFGVDAYATLELKAAALLQSIARNHALVDGNIRLAWLAAVIFLDLNGQPPHRSHDDASALVMGVADGTCEVEQIADRLSVPG